MARKGPSAEARRLGLDSKQANRTLAVKRIRQAAVDISCEIAGSDRIPTHREVFTRAGVTRATYFRYLQADGQLRSSMGWLPSDSGRSAETMASAPASQKPSGHADGQDQLSIENESLKRQIAACKTLVQCFELEAAAMRKEIMARDGLLRAAKGEVEALRARVVVLRTIDRPTPQDKAASDVEKVDVLGALAPGSKPDVGRGTQPGRSVAREHLKLVVRPVTNSSKGEAV